MSKNRIDEEALLSKLKDALGEVESRPENTDPARYVWAYKHTSLYCFLPQSNLETFCSIVEKQIMSTFHNNKAKNEEAKAEYGRTRYDDPLDEYEAQHDELRDIVRSELDAHEDIQRLQLLDELRIVSIYRSIEIARNRKIADVFAGLDRRKLHQITYLRRNIPFWSQVFGLPEIEELRVINNCIKHSGLVSKQLEGMHADWTGMTGKPFHEYLDESSLLSPQRPLNDAYLRIAPYVGAYWNHIVELAAEFSKTIHKENR